MTDYEYVSATKPMLQRLLQSMDPLEFEHFTADLWTYMGWDTRVVGEPGDKGIDVIATTDDGESNSYKPNATGQTPQSEAPKLLC